jgi:hypothetical protein
MITTQPYKVTVAGTYEALLTIDAHSLEEARELVETHGDLDLFAFFQGEMVPVLHEQHLADNSPASEGK